MLSGPPDMDLNQRGGGVGVTRCCLRLVASKPRLSNHFCRRHMCSSPRDTTEWAAAMIPTACTTVMAASPYPLGAAGKRAETALSTAWEKLIRGWWTVTDGHIYADFSDPICDSESYRDQSLCEIELSAEKWEPNVLLSDKSFVIWLISMILNVLRRMSKHPFRALLQQFWSWNICCNTLSWILHWQYFVIWSISIATV